MFAGKIVVSFYKEQYEHYKTRCEKLCLIQIPLGMFLPKISTIG